MDGIYTDLLNTVNESIFTVFINMVGKFIPFFIPWESVMGVKILCLWDPKIPGASFSLDLSTTGNRYRATDTDFNLDLLHQNK